MEKKDLLSERMRNIASQTGSPEAYALIQRMAAQAEELEADRTKLLALLQQGVDAVEKFGQGSSMGASHPHLSNYVVFDEKTWHDRRAFLAACKDVGITPSQD